MTVVIICVEIADDVPGTAVSHGIAVRVGTDAGSGVGATMHVFSTTPPNEVVVGAVQHIEPS